MASYKAQQSADLGKDVVADQIEEEEYIKQSPDNQSISDTKQAPQSSESKKVMPASFMEQDYTGRCALQLSSDNEDDERNKRRRKIKTLASEKKNEVDNDNPSSGEEVKEIESSHSERKRTKTTAELELSDNEVDRAIVRKRKQRSTNMSTKSSEKLRKGQNPEICSSSSWKMKPQCISDVDCINHDMNVTSNLPSLGMVTGSQTNDPGQDNKPNLLNLMTLSTSEGDINIIEKTAVYYDEIGTYLLEDHDGTQVANIKDDYKTSKARVREIYTQWIAKDLSRSWAKLAKCFSKCGLKILASIIERHFELPTPTEIHLQSKEMTSQVSSNEEQQSTRNESGRNVYKSMKAKKKTKANSSSSTSVSDDEDEVIEQSMCHEKAEKRCTRK